MYLSLILISYNVFIITSLNRHLVKKTLIILWQLGLVNLKHVIV